MRWSTLDAPIANPRALLSAALAGRKSGESGHVVGICGGRLSDTAPTLRDTSIEASLRSL